MRVLKQSEMPGLEMTPEIAIKMLNVRAKQIKKAKREESNPIDKFAFQCRAYKVPTFMWAPNECYFALKHNGRKWRFDFAWPDYKLAVEIEGLVVMRDKTTKQLSVKGRHASITGFKEDCIKYATAVELGWGVLRFEQSQVRDGTAIAHTLRSLVSRGWVQPENL